MNRRGIAVVLVWIALGSLAAAPAAEGPVDWNRARQLHQRERAGEKLSPEEQAYLDHAKAERAKQNPAGRAAPAAKPYGESTGFPPLTKGDGEYKGAKLGLYGDGKNDPPADHLKRAREASAAVAPLGADGRPAADGKIVLMSVGMSNTTQEFSRFVRVASDDPESSARLVIVDGAQGGRAADDWSSADRPQTWQEADRRLAAARVTPEQVQVLWVKQALKGPATLAAFPKHAQALEADLKQIVLLAKTRYPNLKLVYLSSRIYGGYATTPLNPEPYAYESAFSVQWLIRSQFRGEDHDLSYDRAPVLLWGPYLWTDGMKGRPGDGLVWKSEDVGPDGTHPSNTGRQKVAELLLAFFKSDPTAKPWFCR
jgi:hypothetical protein